MRANSKRPSDRVVAPGIGVSRLFGLLAIVATGLFVSGCGRASTDARPAHAPHNIAATNPHYFGDYDPDDYNTRLSDGDNDDIRGPRDRDNDLDNKTGSYYDRDDSSVRAFGRPAGAADRRAITALVERYFAAAATDDGHVACSLLYSKLARIIPESYGKPPGPAYLRGKTCPEVMTKLFARNHEQLSTYIASLQVASVRLDHNSGLAVLRFAALPGRQVEVEREHKKWKIYALLDRELP
jgi:hypothetical protein